MAKITLKKEYTTHMTPLMKCIMATRKPVLEYGGGIFSTPLLHWMCKEQGIPLITYETDQMYYEFEKRFQSPGHKIVLVNDWDSIVPDRNVGVVFIDHHPGPRRGIDVVRWKNHADFILMHDSEKPEYHNYHTAYPHFDHVFIWKECKPWTTIVSNFFDYTTLNWPKI